MLYFWKMKLFPEANVVHIDKNSLLNLFSIASTTLLKTLPALSPFYHYPMNLQEHYTNLWEASLARFKHHDFEYDNLLDAPSDDRYGITLLLRPEAVVKSAIQAFLKSLKAIEPDQYYYQNSDIHVTVMSIISCYTGFRIDQIDPQEYFRVIGQSLAGLEPFQIRFKGITASPSAIMLQGFPENDTLNQLRDRLRENFKNSELQQSLDKRYAIQTAHTTVVRLRKPLADPAPFIEKLKSSRETDFGTTTVSEVELVYNDWYQKQAKVEKLKSFVLAGKS
jgi:2'-5' RNA ligase